MPRGQLLDAVAQLRHAGGREGVGLGDLAKAGVLAEAEVGGDGVGGEAAEQLGLADRVEHLFDLAGRGGQPAGAAGGQDQLLDLELVGEGLEQLPLAPQHRGQVFHAHRRGSLRVSWTGAFPTSAGDGVA